MEDARLGVSRVAGRDLRHRGFVGRNAVLLPARRRIGVELGDCFDVAVFPLGGAGGCAPGSFYGLHAGRDCRRRTKARRHRVTPPPERNAPPRHGAGGVGRQHVMKFSHGCGKLKGMQQRHAPVELGRH